MRVVIFIFARIYLLLGRDLMFLFEFIWREKKQNGFISADAATTILHASRFKRHAAFIILSKRLYVV